MRTVASASACMHSRCNTVTAASGWRAGSPDARIEGVRPAPALVPAQVPAVARGGDGHVAERDACRDAGRGIDLDLPGLAVGAVADTAQFAAHFNEKILEAERLQSSGHLVDRKALRDAREIERYAARLQDRILGGIEGEPLPADARARCREIGGRGRRWRWRCVGVRSETPESDQGADGRIDRAIALRSPLQCAGKHFGEFGRQRVRAAGGGAVEAADVRVGFPGAHLGDHAVQRGLCAGTNAVERNQERVVEPERPRRAHGSPGELLQTRRIGATRNGRVGVATRAPDGERRPHVRRVPRRVQGITSRVAA